MKYLINLEPTTTAYSPDLDGCVAADDDRAGTIALIRVDATCSAKERPTTGSLTAVEA